jgi:hypothetical protein
MFGFIKKLFGGNAPEVAAEVVPYKVEAAPVVEQPAKPAATPVKKTPQAKPVQGRKPRGRKPTAK